MSNSMSLYCLTLHNKLQPVADINEKVRDMIKIFKELRELGAEAKYSKNRPEEEVY